MPRTRGRRLTKNKIARTKSQLKASQRPKQFSEKSPYLTTLYKGVSKELAKERPGVVMARKKLIPETAFNIFYNHKVYLEMENSNLPEATDEIKKAAIEYANKKMRNEFLPEKRKLDDAK